jgi:hypothetical protein
MPEFSPPGAGIEPEVIGDDSGSEYQYADPLGWFYTTLDGIDFAQELGAFIETENPWLLGNVFGTGLDFANSLSDLMNTPSQETFDEWNAWGANMGIAPGAVYIGTNSITGESWFDISLNSITGNSGYQISWHEAVDSTDTSGPIIDFF